MARTVMRPRQPTPRRECAAGIFISRGHRSGPGDPEEPSTERRGAEGQYQDADERSISWKQESLVAGPGTLEREGTAVEWVAWLRTMRWDWFATPSFRYPVTPGRALDAVTAWL